MSSVVAYNGNLGTLSQWGPGAKPLVRKSGERSPPPKNETLFGFGRSMKVTNLCAFLKFENAKSDSICVVIVKNSIRHRILCINEK